MTGDRVELASWLIGRWSIHRAINDDPDAFVGVASFSYDAGPDGAIRWCETGRLRLGSYLGNAHRILEVVPRGTSPSWEVRFDDGRHFHDLNLSTGRCEVQHPCRADLYTGAYVIEGADALSVTWLVSGPGRHDRIVSDYRRLCGDVDRRRVPG
jgi:hypothetical protein